MDSPVCIVVCRKLQRFKRRESTDAVLASELPFNVGGDNRKLRFSVVYYHNNRFSMVDPQACKIFHEKRLLFFHFNANHAVWLQYKANSMPSCFVELQKVLWIKKSYRTGFLRRNCTLFAPFIINGAILSLKYSVSGTKVRPLFFRVIQFSLWQGKSFCPQSSGHFQGDELMTSQCPPFLVPTRLSSFFSFRLVIFFSTAVVLMPILFAISVMLILGSCSASPRMLL